MIQIQHKLNNVYTLYNDYFRRLISHVRYDEIDTAHAMDSGVHTHEKLKEFCHIFFENIKHIYSFRYPCKEDDFEKGHLVLKKLTPLFDGQLIVRLTKYGCRRKMESVIR